MARIEQITMVDDIDGSTDGVGTVRFGLDDKSYEIDLSEANAKELRSALAGYIESGRKVSTSRALVRSPRGQASEEMAEQRARNERIRGWAVGNGLKISDRGRIPTKILEAYRAGDPALAS